MKNRLQHLLLCLPLALGGIVACGTDVVGGGSSGGAGSGSGSSTSSSSGSGSTSSGVACTAEARSSVTVKVVDASGAIVVDAALTFSVNGGAQEMCDVAPDGMSYVCGYERDGTITITATKGADTKTATVTVTKTPDGCHVESQTLTITLGA